MNATEREQRFRAERPDLGPEEKRAEEDRYYSIGLIECDECGKAMSVAEYEPYLDCDCDQDGFFQTNRDLCGPCRQASETERDS